MFLKTRQLIVSLFSGIALSSFILAPQLVKAQVQVSPMVITLETEQGQASGVITLTNSSNQEASLTLHTEPFIYGENGFQTVETSENDLSPYLMFSPTEVVLQPGQVRRVRLLVRLLPSSAQQEYRAAMFAEPPENVPAEGGFSIRTRVAIAIYVRHGEVSFGLEPQNVSYDQENKVINLRVNNSGTATIRPQIRWSLTHNGQEISSGDIQEFTIMAQSDRLVEIELQSDQELASGEYVLKGEIISAEPDFSQTIPFNFNVNIP